MFPCTISSCGTKGSAVANGRSLTAGHDDVDPDDAEFMRGIIRPSLHELLVAAQSLVADPKAFPAAVLTLTTARALLELYREYLIKSKPRPEKADKVALEAQLNNIITILKNKKLQTDEHTSSSMLMLIVSGTLVHSAITFNINYQLTLRNTEQCLNLKSNWPGNNEKAATAAAEQILIGTAQSVMSMKVSKTLWQGLSSAAGLGLDLVRTTLSAEDRKPLVSLYHLKKVGSEFL